MISVVAERDGSVGTASTACVGSGGVAMGLGVKVGTDSVVGSAASLLGVGLPHANIIAMSSMDEIAIPKNLCIGGFLQYRPNPSHQMPVAMMRRVDPTFGSAYEIRTRVFAVRGQYPRPLDECAMCTRLSRFYAFCAYLSNLHPQPTRCNSRPHFAL